MTITFVGGAYTATTVTYWKDLAAKFEAANPGYKVNIQIIDWTNIDQQVATMIQNIAPIAVRAHDRLMLPDATGTPVKLKSQTCSGKPSS